MKTQRLLLPTSLVLFIAMVCAPASTALAQGSLTPPGPPAAVMKTLDQIEPRTIVNPNNTPGDSLSSFKITNSGAYYLTGNVSGEAGKHGILITASGVTLDLNGFSLIGAPGSLDGINATNSNGLAAGLVVRNGTVAGWAGNGINAQPGAPGAQFLKLNLLTNALMGLKATGALISDCISEGNTSNGFTNYAITGNGCRIINCIVKTNYNGIFAGSGTLVEGCVADDNAFGILASDSSILHCTVYNNSADGMYLFNNNRVSGNFIDGNGHGKGIEVAGSSSGNTIDGNTLLGSPMAGISLSNAGVANNFVLRNTVRGAGANNYQMGTGNAYGPIVNVAGSNDVSTVTNANHPLANLSY